MPSERLLGGLRDLLGQEASIPALRAILFLFGASAATAWLRRAPRLALCLSSVGGLLGLLYWMIQISAPFGLGTDVALTRQWAQAGVNAFATPGGTGYVWGTAPEHSLIGALASLGVPAPLVFLIPQFSVLGCFVLVTILPWTFMRNRTTAAFSACLVGGGGLWPGGSVYAAILLRPSLSAIAVAALVAALVMARRSDTRRLFNRDRLALATGLIVAAALGRAWKGGLEPPAFGAFLLVAASLILASPLRALLRRTSSSAPAARRIEAGLLLAAFCGSFIFWWDPTKSVPGFFEATDAGAAFERPLSWIAQNVPTGDVILASPSYSAPIAALAGRRVLFTSSTDASGVASLPEPFRRARLRETTLRGQPIARLADAFSVTHLFLGPGEASPPAPEAAPPTLDDEPRLSLVLVYRDAEDFRIFRFAKK